MLICYTTESRMADVTKHTVRLDHDERALVNVNHVAEIG